MTSPPMREPAYFVLAALARAAALVITPGAAPDHAWPGLLARKPRTA